MATVTIPVEGRGGNPVRVMINGVEYVIPRGVETTVSDAVAAELAKLDMALIGGGGYTEDGRILPVVDATDNDKVLTVVNGAWEPAAPSGGDLVIPDGSLTEQKLSDALKLETIKDYVTPEMFGAKGDGITDDTQAIMDALAYPVVVLLPNKEYKITSRIEITNEHRLIAIGDTVIYTDVADDYAFWIHGETGADYIDINKNYDTYKGVWFGGTDGGITVVNSNGDTSDCILFGVETIVSGGTGMYGANAISQIANVGINGFRTGIQITDKNNYLNTFTRVHFEKCTNDVVFGVSGGTKTNSGELVKFFDCIFSTSEYAFIFNTMGWECSLINCSIDFCTVAFRDSNYIKVNLVNCHLEGIGNRSGSATEYGIVYNEGSKSDYSFTNVTFVIDNPNLGTVFFTGSGSLVVNNCYMSSTIAQSVISGEYFLSEQPVTLIGTFFGQAGYRQFLSGENNLVPDALLSNATLGSTNTAITNGIVVAWKAGCTSEVVNGTMFAGQKSIRFNGTGSGAMNGIVTVTIPVTPLKTYNIGVGLLKNHDKEISRSVKARFYNKDGTQIGETTESLYIPTQPEKNVLYFPYTSRQIKPIAGTAYMTVLFSISTKNNETLDVGEYIDVEYMYIEAW